jgi:hypothetical protein
MTLVGKILTVVIFVFSIGFSFMTFAVYFTHKNWYLAVNNEDASKGKIGLKKQLADAQNDTQQLQDELAALEKKLQGEVINRRVDLAKSESARLAKEQENAKLTTTHQTELQALGAANATMKATQDQLAAFSKELEGLRQDIRTTQEDRDTTFVQVQEQTDKNHQLLLALRQLENRGMELAGQIAKMRNVLTKVGLTPDTNVSGIAPPVDGLITNIQTRGENITVTVSVGKDDGIEPGYILNAYRGDTFLGKMEVLRVQPDQAVCQNLTKYYVKPFRVGDVVKTDRSQAAPVARQAAK